MGGGWWAWRVESGCEAGMKMKVKARNRMSSEQRARAHKNKNKNRTQGSDECYGDGPGIPLYLL